MELCKFMANLLGGTLVYQENGNCFVSSKQKTSPDSIPNRMSESTLENTEGRQKQDQFLAATITTYYHSALSTVSLMFFLAIHRETAMYVNTSIKGKHFHKSLEETSPCTCTPTPKHHSSCLCPYKVWLQTRTVGIAICHLPVPSWEGTNTTALFSDF